MYTVQYAYLLLVNAKPIIYSMLICYWSILLTQKAALSTIGTSQTQNTLYWSMTYSHLLLVNDFAYLLLVNDLSYLLLVNDLFSPAIGQ